jgi:hypothetical protein
LYFFLYIANTQNVENAISTHEKKVLIGFSLSTGISNGLYAPEEKEMHAHECLTA